MKIAPSLENEGANFALFIARNSAKISASGQTCVKGEKRACSTLEVGKNKPIDYIAKTRDFKRFSEKNKEKSGILRLPIFGLSDKT